tara:strand:+ start:60 stop:587 length:528 start_codon:yes stop_codon:yes gene_type:complete
MSLNFRFKKKSPDFSDLQNKPGADYEFSQAINIFKSQRKSIGISLEELSKKTKISRNVLIAIENGWKKYLPESTYLTSMLKKLELELKLERGSLNGLLSQEVTIKNLSRFKFNFINIDFLNNWIGSLIYFILMLLSILAINSQQKYLLKLNSISTEPILLEDTNIDNKNTITSKE